MNRHYKTLTTLVMGLGVYTSVAAETSLLDMTPQTCLQDFEYTENLILKNDAGVVAKKWDGYPETIQQLVEQQKAKISAVQNTLDCRDAIQPFLNSMRGGHHLGVIVEPELYAASEKAAEKFKSAERITGQQHDNEIEKVSTKKLSESTTLLTILSFDHTLYEKIKQVVISNQDDLLTAPFLIIDLRSNGGGSDHSASILFKILGEAEYRSQYPAIYASSANIEGWEAYRSGMPNQAALEELNHKIEKMRAHPNQWVDMFDSNEGREFISGQDILATPQKVVILTDKNCGSSCEQFVLDARQNPRVVTMGRPTTGALDASNIMEKLSPSKKLVIYYASTYVHRPAGQEIDEIGIPPDISLARPQNKAEYDAEIQFVQRYLEAGQR